ncbi:hypothetical protein BDF19DRAFT_460287 [Syncephalis fuscata]|nr:hypothetical protein BDF19DRAFT_460287 [Syncephalis fuscata]
MTFLHMPNPEQCGTASWLPKPIHNPNQHKSSSNDVSRCIPSVLINNEQQNLSAIHPRADKIHELKAMMAVQKARMQEQKVQMQEQKAQMQKQQAQMEAQIKQFTVMTNRLATLEGDTNINNSNIPLDKPTPNSTCLPNTSMAHHSKSFASTSSALPLEARVSNLESFQHRLGTFYLSSDLFKDTSFS